MGVGKTSLANMLMGLTRCESKCGPGCWASSTGAASGSGSMGLSPPAAAAMIASGSKALALLFFRFAAEYKNTFSCLSAVVKYVFASRC